MRLVQEALAASQMRMSKVEAMITNAAADQKMRRHT